MPKVRIAGAALLAAAVAACVPRTAPPASAPVLPPAPAPAPLPSAPPLPPVNWLDAPLSPGGWHYRRDGAVALASYRSGSLTFTLRCEPTRSVTLWLTGAQAPALAIRTTYGERRLPAAPVHLNEMQATLPAGDPLLDQMAFSRGRILVQPEGGPALIVPAWPEIARIIEDCRGQ